MRHTARPSLFQSITSTAPPPASQQMTAAPQFVALPIQIAAGWILFAQVTSFRWWRDEGGVLIRSGHTEAAVDLCRLAGLPEVGVICELVNDDGSVMRGPQIAAFAEEKELKTVTVADLIAYRQRQENIVTRVEEFDIETSAGPASAFAYSTPWDPMQHLAVVFGDIRDGQNIPVRLQRESVVEDAFGGAKSMTAALTTIASHGRGVVVYLRDGSVGVAKQSHRLEREEGHNTARNREEEWLEIGLGAQILKDLGVETISLLASRERHYVGLDGFGIEIARTEIIDG